MTVMSLVVIGVIIAVSLAVYTSEVKRTTDRLEQVSKSERVNMGEIFNIVSEDDTENDTYEATEDGEQPIPKDRRFDPLKRVEIDTFLVKFYSNSVYPTYYEYHTSEDFDSDELYNLAVKINLSVSNGDVPSRGLVEFNGSQYRYLMSKDSLVLVNRQSEIDALQRVLVPLLLSGLVALIIFFAISVFLAYWTTKPIEKSWTKQREFVADASHELKTPLTVIDANIDVVLNNKDKTIESQDKWLRNIKEETKSMSALVNDLLNIAKSDAGRTKFEPCEFNLSDTVENLVLGFEIIAFEKGKTLNSDIGENINYVGDKDSIKQLIKILLDNAVKYSAENGNIFVELKQTDKHKIQFIVSNDGELISEEDRKRIFERFYRTDKSRARVTGGSGLGLSIAEAIVHQHKGTIKAEIIDNKYNSFVVIF